MCHGNDVKSSAELGGGIVGESIGEKDIRERASEIGEGAL